jgi:hypothetical protein
MRLILMIEQNVRRLQVAMQDASVVGVPDGFSDGAHQFAARRASEVGLGSTQRDSCLNEFHR